MHPTGNFSVNYVSRFKPTGEMKAKYKGYFKKKTKDYSNLKFFVFSAFVLISKLLIDKF